MRRRLGALAWFAIASGAVSVALAVATTGPAVTGCTTHQCDQSTYEWSPAPALADGGHVAGHGFMADEDTYMTNGIDDDWLPFDGNTTIQIWFPPEVARRTPEIPPIVAVGTDQSPNSPAARDAGGNYTQAAGLAIFNVLNTDPVIGPDGGTLYGGGFALTNVSCALYFTHVEVHFLPREGPTKSTGSADSGAQTELDAGADGSD